MAKLSVAAAAAQLVRAKELQADGKWLKDAAEPVLRERFDSHPKERTYKDLIALVPGSRTQLDTAKVKAFLGKRLGEFQRLVTWTALAVLDGE